MINIREAAVAAFDPKLDEKTLDGWKLIIGIILISATGGLDTVQRLIDFIPDASYLSPVEAGLTLLIDMSQRLLTILGSGFLSFGLLDKLLKFVSVLNVSDRNSRKLP